MVQMVSVPVCHKLSDGFESHQLLKKSVDQKRLGCNAGIQDVNVCWVRGGSEDCAGDKVRKQRSPSRINELREV